MASGLAKGGLPLQFRWPDRRVNAFPRLACGVGISRLLIRANDGFMFVDGYVCRVILSPASRVEVIGPVHRRAHSFVRVSTKNPARVLRLSIFEGALRHLIG